MKRFGIAKRNKKGKEFLEFNTRLVTPSNTLSRLEIEKIDKIKSMVLKSIISRPIGTITVDKDWLIDDSELNSIPIVKKPEKVWIRPRKALVTLGKSSFSVYKIKDMAKRAWNNLRNLFQLKVNLFIEEGEVIPSYF